MIDPDADISCSSAEASVPNNNPAVSRHVDPQPEEQHRAARSETRRWWIKLFLQPILFLACGVLLIMGLGVAQRLGIISATGTGLSQVSSTDRDTRYICPMMCTPPQAEPGRCPVCAMELVPAMSDGGATDSRSILIDPATRRVANIQTVAVVSLPLTRTIRAIGDLQYDEGTLKTISAYVDGRLDRLYADYTGVVVKEGDHLALLYSPRLYSGQVELLMARKARDRGRSATLSGISESTDGLYTSAKERLILLGMTEMQIEHLEQAGKANSRMYLCAPIGGTVIEKLAVEGQYVKEGDAIYKLADLSTVWLMLRLFPEDAATIRYGQKVKAEVRSLPGRSFSGRVAFVDPNVDPKTRTVGVRVVMSNQDGMLRVGDYAKAIIDVPLGDSHQSLAYDPELANKWISPRHPHVISDTAGECPICGVELLPATHFGYANEPTKSSEALVVPRDAVLMAGNTSVLYTETESGRFEIRRVVVGPSVGDHIVIHSGVKLGERVAARGNFLIDSQMQLAGNPSLIDPTRIDAADTEFLSPEIIAALSPLSEQDRELVLVQQLCPVTEQPLGSMGTPPKVDLDGTSVFLCCEGCRDSLLRDPKKYLDKLASMRTSTSSEDHAMQAPSMDLPPIGVPQIIEPASMDEQTDTARHDHPSAPTGNRNTDSLPPEETR